MEDELLQNNNNIPNLLDVFEDKPAKPMVLSGQNPYNSNTIVQYGGKKSKYDKNFLPNLLDVFSDKNEQRNINRANEQTGWDQLGNSAARLVNIVPEAISTVANALDIEDYFNTDDEVGNWLSTLVEENIKNPINEAFPIYRKNPGKALDFGDSGWWYENGSGLVNSIGGFAFGGGVLAKGLSGLSKITKAKKLSDFILGANKSEKFAQGISALTQATMLNQAEGIMEATDVYKTVYDFELQNGSSEEDAKKKAAESASITVSTNRLNILLNLSSASLFFKSPKLSRQLLKKEGIRSTLSRTFLEGGQESAEEVINFISSQRGKAFGKGELYGYNEIIKDLGSADALENALLGFLGGMGNTIVTEQGVNRLKTSYDPLTGNPISVHNYNKQAYQKQQEELNVLKNYKQYTGNVKDFTSVYNTFVENVGIINNIQEAVKKEEYDEAAKLQNLLLTNQAYNAFQNGTTEQLIDLYKSLGEGERKEGMPSNYKETSNKAVETIEKLEKLYNDSYKFVNQKQVYLNGAKKLDLLNQFDNLTNLKEEISSELSREINALQSPYSTKAEGVFFVDIDNLDYNPDTEKEGREKYNSFVEKVKQIPSYFLYNDIKKQLNTISDNISKSNEDYQELTSDDYQKKYKEKLEKVQQSIDNKIKKDSDKLQEETEKKQEQLKQEQLKNKTSNLDKQTELEKELEKDNEKESIDYIGNNFNEGETFIMPNNLTRAGEEVTLLSKSDKTLQLKDKDNKVFSVSYKKDVSKNTNIDYDTEGSEIEEDINWNTIHSEGRTKPGEEGRKHVRLLSTTDEGNLLPGISQEWLDYERAPISKFSKLISFEINRNIPNDKKSSKWKQALDLLNKKDKSQEDINYIIDYLPIKAKVSDDIFTFLTSKPQTFNKDSLEAWETTEQPLRSQIVNHLLETGTLDNINSTIMFQYPGLLQLDRTNGVPENNIMDLKQINSLEDVKLLMLNEHGFLVNSTGNVSDYKQLNPNWKGSIFLEVKKANGEFFPLKLNLQKVSNTVAETIYDIYEEVLLREDIKTSSYLNELNPVLQETIKTNFSDELILLNGIKDTTIKEFINFFIYDGSRNIKSQVRLEGAKLLFGTNSVYRDNLNGESKEDFIEFLTTQKRRNIKFKKRPDEGNDSLTIENSKYLDYLISNKVLNTNAKVNDDLFKGYTYLYINPILNINKETKVVKENTKNVGIKINLTPYNKEVDGDIIPAIGYSVGQKSGRVFKNKDVDTTKAFTDKDIVGELITNNNIIDKVEKEIRNDDIFGDPNITLVRYNEQENLEENILKSPKNLVSLQDIPNTKENLEEKKAIEQKKQENTGKLSREEKRARIRNQYKIKEGVNEIFNQNPELSSIGTRQQYSQYLDTIFPNSKVKDIVYHATLNKNNILNEGFKKINTRTKTFNIFDPTGELKKRNNLGFFFAKNGELIKYFLDGGFLEEELKEKNQKNDIISVILNFKNPQFLDKIEIKNVKNEFDSIISNEEFHISDNSGGINYTDEIYIAYKSEQIHILGSKQDIERFKNYIDNNESNEPLQTKCVNN